MGGILGKKIGMTQVFSEGGQVFPVTILQLGPCSVLDIKTKEKEGYSSVQLGFDDSKKIKNTSKAQLGHFKKSSTENKPHRIIKEVKLDGEYKLGDKITAEYFKNIKYVDVIGKTKGRGFQGVVKRYNFGGGRASHGGDWLRKPGAVGMCQFPGRIFKGKKMPGHMGNSRKTIQNLQVVEVREKENIILVKGAVPGYNGSYILVQSAKKK